MNILIEKYASLRELWHIELRYKLRIIITNIDA